MKVLMVSPFYYPIIGGTESFVEAVSTKLNKKGIIVDIMTFNVDKHWKPWSITQFKRHEIERINGLNVLKVPAITLLPTRIIFRINFIPGKFLDKIRDYDILHFHNDIDLSFPIFSLHIDKKKIFHCHCLHLTYNSFRVNCLQRNLFAKLADIYIVQTKILRRMLAELGISESQIRVVPNGIDTDKFKPKYQVKTENLLLFVGRLDPKKGLPVLLDALKYLKTDAQLVIIGPPSRPWFFKKILKLISRINETTNHKVSYLGILKRRDVIEWYQKASIFVCPSLSELFGIVNLEALACATPVVATKVGGIPEVVKNGQNGILVPPNDAKKLAEAIEYLLNNKEIREKFGENGRRWVVKNFSIEVVAERIYNIYKEIMEK